MVPSEPIHLPALTKLHPSEIIAVSVNCLACPWSRNHGAVRGEAALMLSLFHTGLGPMQESWNILFWFICSLSVLYQKAAS